MILRIRLSDGKKNQFFKKNFLDFFQLFGHPSQTKDELIPFYAFVLEHLSDFVHIFLKTRWHPKFI